MRMFQDCIFIAKTFSFFLNLFFFNFKNLIKIKFIAYAKSSLTHQFYENLKNLTYIKDERFLI